MDVAEDGGDGLEVLFCQAKHSDILNHNKQQGSTEYLSSHNTTHYTSITGWRSDGYCCSVITLVLYHIHGEWFTFGRENYQQFCTWHMAALTVAITLSDSRQTLPRQPIRDQTDSDLGSQSDGRQPLGTSALHSEMRRVTKSNWYCTGQQFN